MVDAVHSPSLTGRPLRLTPNTGLLAWSVFSAFLAIIVLHAAGLIGAAMLPVIAVGGVLCGVVGIHLNRPVVAWPWWCLVGTGVTWAIAGLVRETTGATGVLTDERSLIPDLFALPGYASMAAALVGFFRARTGGADRDALFDAVVLVSGASLVVHEVLIVPTMEIDETWLLARIAVAIYPVLSLCLLALAARIAFSQGGRCTSMYLLLAGVGSLVVGDFVFAAGEVGLLALSWSLLDVPYLMVPALMGVALLHPSSRLLDETLPAQRRVMSRSRRLTVCVAILAPVIVLLVDDVSEPRLVSALLCVLLAGTAALRIGLAMQGEVTALRRLSHQATHDDLTGLPTRQLLTERADRMLRSGTGSLAVIFIDLDRFKLVNDSVGHSAGDGLLVAVAERLLASAPPHAMVSRVSGDEFLVLVGADAAEALEVAECLRAALCEPFAFGSGADVFSSASIGVAVSNPSIPTDGVTLMREADAAMYRSKENGRNMVTMFDATMRERVERRVEVEQDLRTAVDAGTISVNYQVVVSWPESRVVGLEALARWTRNNGEQIAPAEFIDIAEESGLIVPLGDFVLEEALRQVAWLRANVPGASDLHVAVNVSPRQFRTGDLADVVEELLLKYGLPGDALCLEITEGVLMVDSIAAAATMAAISSLGVRLAVDDFGTGFSSLSYLQRFPIDVVKIDRSFVRDVATDDGARTLVAAIVGMARALRLGVVAEGVETEEQARRLRNIGCETMQGFWWGAAVPIVDVRRLIVSIAERGERARRARCASVRN